MQPSGSLDAAPGNRSKVPSSPTIFVARRQTHLDISPDDPPDDGIVKRVIWRFRDAGFTRSCYTASDEVVDLGEIK
jgi:hypothetical protein